MDKSPDILIPDLVCPEIDEEDEMDTVCATTDAPIPVVRPPPGFWQFSWPREEWRPGGDPSLFDFAKELPGWFPWGYGGQPVDPPTLPVSPILQSSLDDSVIANVGSSREESNTPAEAVIATQTVGDALPVRTDSNALADSPSPDVERTFSVSPLGHVADIPKYVTSHVRHRSPGMVPHWQLAREGPFLVESSSSSLRSFGAGCAFRNTTYGASDYASPSGQFGMYALSLQDAGAGPRFQ